MVLGPAMLNGTEESMAGGHGDEDVGVRIGANEDGYDEGRVNQRDGAC